MQWYFGAYLPLYISGKYFYVWASEQLHNMINIDLYSNIQGVVSNKLWSSGLVSIVKYTHVCFLSVAYTSKLLWCVKCIHVNQHWFIYFLQSWYTGILLIFCSMHTMKLLNKKFIQIKIVFSSKNCPKLYHYKWVNDYGLQRGLNVIFFINCLISLFIWIIHKLI